MFSVFSVVESFGLVLLLFFTLAFPSCPSCLELLLSLLVLILLNTNYQLLFFSCSGFTPCAEFHENVSFDDLAGVVDGVDQAHAVGIIAGQGRRDFKIAEGCYHLPLYSLLHPDFVLLPPGHTASLQLFLPLPKLMTYMNKQDVLGHREQVTGYRRSW